jgi:MYXO-CTERM domain-containing protein
VADAGADQTVMGGDEVTLDASGSSDPDNDILTFAWTQTAGPTVDLSAADASVTMFTAPDVDEDTTLTFEVSVSDGVATVTDTVNILVQPMSSSTTTGSGSGSTSTGGAVPPTYKPSAAPSGGCGCTVESNASSDAPLVSLLGLGLLLARRRRRGQA